MKSLLAVIIMTGLIRAAFAFCSEEYLCGRDLVQQSVKEF